MNKKKEQKIKKVKKGFKIEIKIIFEFIFFLLFQNNEAVTSFYKIILK